MLFTALIKREILTAGQVCTEIGQLIEGATTWYAKPELGAIAFTDIDAHVEKLETAVEWKPTYAGVYPVHRDVAVQDEKKHLRFREQFQRHQQRIQEATAKLAAQDLKIKVFLESCVEAWHQEESKMKSCPHCKSILSKQHLQYTDCPLCGGSILSPSDTKTVVAMRAKRDTYQADLDELNAKQIEIPEPIVTTEEYWLIVSPNEFMLEDLVARVQVSPAA